jgi:hypothetical protein
VLVRRITDLQYAGCFRVFPSCAGTNAGCYHDPDTPPRSTTRKSNQIMTSQKRAVLHMAFGYAGAWMLGWTTPGGVFVRRVVIFWIAVVVIQIPCYYHVDSQGNTMMAMVSFENLMFFLHSIGAVDPMMVSFESILVLSTFLGGFLRSS